MDEAELIGGVLIACLNPRASASQLAELLLAPQLDRSAAINAGLEPELVEVLRGRMGTDFERVQSVCQEAAAWVLGRRSVAPAEQWELVASLPSAITLPDGLHRTTAETLIQLIVQANTSLRLAAPFIDQSGLSFMSEALTAATSRGVKLEIILPTRCACADGALNDLRKMIAAEGRSYNLKLSSLRGDAPWAHLKVLISDLRSAYIGSANATGAGIGGRNLELGVLVSGTPVPVIEHILDLFRSD